MKFLVVTGNPKKDGLCHAVTERIMRGAADGGAEAEILNVNGMAACRCCGDGWGSCGRGDECSFGEGGFNEAQKAVREADMLCLVTPVYWGECAEGLKNFMDRLRRCDFGSRSALSGKQALLVASPGGSGGGLLICLGQMERFCHHTGAAIFDYIGVNRWNSDYKKAAAYSAAKAMAEGRKAGATV